MKYAIAAEGPDLESYVSEKAARAPYLLIFNNKELVKAIKNPFAIGGGGAGYSVAYMLANENISEFWAPQIGPNMEIALESKNIKFKKIKVDKIKNII